MGLVDIARCLEQTPMVSACKIKTYRNTKSMVEIGCRFLLITVGETVH
jgi:hypothetical protein